MAGLCSLHQIPDIGCVICKTALETKSQPIAFTVRNGCENSIDTGGVDIYVVPEQPVTVKAFYDNKELAKWLVRYKVEFKETETPSTELVDAILDAIVTFDGDITE